MIDGCDQQTAVVQNFGCSELRMFRTPDFFLFIRTPVSGCPSLWRTMTSSLGPHSWYIYTAGLSLYSSSPIMPGPFRRRRAHQEPIDDNDVLPYVQNAGTSVCGYTFHMLIAPQQPISAITTQYTPTRLHLCTTSSHYPKTFLHFLEATVTSLCVIQAVRRPNLTLWGWWLHHVWNRRLAFRSA